MLADAYGKLGQSLLIQQNTHLELLFIDFLLKLLLVGDSGAGK
jgi:hypothetical protein